MIAWQTGIAPGDLQSIDFRKKLPGTKANEKGVEVVGFGDATEVRHTDIVQAFFGTNYNHGFFKYNACDFCDDVVAETADISIGDAWLPEYLDDGRGTNIIVTRHPVVQRLIEEGISSARLQLEPIGVDQVVRSQEGGFRHRREGLAYRLYLHDKSALWHPVKRVEAQCSQLDSTRRSIYRTRLEMARQSHEAFECAVQSKCFSVFRDQMQQLLSAYTSLYTPKQPLWRRIWNRAINEVKRLRYRIKRTDL
jgi:hypothetical protein